MVYVGLSAKALRARGRGIFRWRVRGWAGRAAGGGGGGGDRGRAGPVRGVTRERVVAVVGKQRRGRRVWCERAARHGHARPFQGVHSGQVLHWAAKVLGNGEEATRWASAPARPGRGRDAAAVPPDNAVVILLLLKMFPKSRDSFYILTCDF